GGCRSIGGRRRLAPGVESVLYRPLLYVRSQLHFKRVSAGVDEWVDVTTTVPLDSEAKKLLWDDLDSKRGKIKVRKRAAAKARFGTTPAVVGNKRAWSSSRKALVAELYRNERRNIYSCKALKLMSEEHESEGDFRVRAQQAHAEKRDLAVAKLKASYAEDFEKLEKRIRTAEERIDREESQLRDRRVQTAVSFGSSLLGALLGRKKLSVTNARSASTALRNVGRSRREKDDVERAEERLEDLTADKQELEAEFEREVEALRSKSIEIDIDVLELPPLKTDIAVESLGLLWAPWTVDADGIATPLFDLED
ncbi:MAG: hypothetical protein AAGA81_23760, partial [Acidobacteriota bacterium]